MGNGRLSSFSSLSLKSPFNAFKARLVNSAKDYRWSSFRAMYMNTAEPVEIDKDWWWPDDVRKLSIASSEWIKEKVTAAAKERGKGIKRG